MFHSRAVLLAVVALAGLGVWAFDRILTVCWVGSFPLEVRLVPNASRQVVKVLADTYPWRQHAEEIRRDIRCADCILKPVDWFNDYGFTLEVVCSGHDSGLGFRRSYGQYQLLILQFEYADGTSRHEVVEIPDGRFRRSVSVNVP